jgi:hypothetical protein
MRHSKYTRTEWAAVRRPALSRLGIQPDAIEFIIDLELAESSGIIGAMRQLSRQPAWPGRKVQLAGSGRWLEYDGNLWLLI